MSDALPLPPRPNLEQYKKLARDLQDACKSSDPVATRNWVSHWIETLARLVDIPIWPTRHSNQREVQRIEQRWTKLMESSQSASKCTLAAAQFFIAREHGFASWPKFARHIQELARTNTAVSAFEAAADAIVAGDASTLRKLLADHPGLALERSTREHRSTLLHYVSANGIEDFRQKTPKNIVEITKLLLDAGADVNAESEAYGGGSTALGLVATSVHPEQAGVQIDLLQTLLDRGATLFQPSAGGNGQSVVRACLANGQPAAARFLADLGAPLDLESAAALGRLPVLQSYFDESGAPRPEIDKNQLESAFVYACGYGSRDAAEFLLDHGVHPAARNNDGQTGLHWANYGPHIDVIKLLLERGAPVDVRDTQFHAAPLDMALWTWDHTRSPQDHERCYEAIALLARAGAKFDPDQWRNPGEEASDMLKKINSDPRMLASLRGETSQ